MSQSKSHGFIYLIKIAYRNIYRNVRRSLFCVAGISIAVFFIIMMMSFIGGMFASMLHTIYTYDIGHIQIFTKEYEEKQDFKPLQYPIEPPAGNLTAMLDSIRALPEVKAVAPRIITVATLVSNNVKHSILWGMDIDNELKANLLNLRDRSDGLLLGRFPEEGRNECMIGYRMANKIRLISRIMNETDYQTIVEKIGNEEDKNFFTSCYQWVPDNKTYQLVAGKKTVIKTSFIDRLKALKGIKSKPAGTDLYNIDKATEMKLFKILVATNEMKLVFKIISSLYSEKYVGATVVGIFDFDYALFDRECIIMPFGQVQKFASLRNKTQLINIYLHQPDLSDSVTAKIRKLFNNPDLVIKNWKKNTFLSWLNMVKSIYAVIFSVFVIIASFLIVNTIIMVIHERMKEIGMMGALGMNRREIISVFFLEAVLLSLIGSFIGAILGGVITFILSLYPINFETMSGGIDMPISNTIFIQFSLLNVLFGFFYGLILSSVCTIIPSFKPAFIEPVEALRR